MVLTGVGLAAPVGPAVLTGVGRVGLAGVGRVGLADPAMAGPVGLASVDPRIAGLGSTPNRLVDSGVTTRGGRTVGRPGSNASLATLIG